MENAGYTLKRLTQVHDNECDECLDDDGGCTTKNGAPDAVCMKH